MSGGTADPRTRCPGGQLIRGDSWSSDTVTPRASTRTSVKIKTDLPGQRGGSSEPPEPPHGTGLHTGKNLQFWLGDALQEYCLVVAVACGCQCW